MKILLAVFAGVLYLFCTAFVLSQSGWYSVNSGTNIQLNSVGSYGLKACAVGNNGTILRTTNGGVNWVSVPSGTNNNLTHILMRGDSIAYIAGGQGTVLRSTDSGASWVLLNTASASDLQWVWPLFDNMTVLAVGTNGTILKSYNQGQSWSQRPSPVSVTFNSIISGFPMDLIAVGDNGKVIYSGDMGETWVQQISGTSSTLRSLSVINLWSFTSIVHAVGDNGTILKTTNSGNDWIPLISGTNQNLRSVSATHISGDTMLYYITVGEAGIVLESVNGSQWVDRGLSFAEELRSIDMQDMNTGFIAGSNGAILKSVGNYFFAESKKLDANSISAHFRNDGGFNNIRNNQTLPGFEWPKGSGKFARYVSGLWLGAVVNGETRVTTSGYENEYYPGYTGNNHIPAGRNDTNYRIYQLIHGISNSDRLNWPNALLGNSDQGAPVYFEAASNSWKPLDFGSQTMFYSYTDSYPESHINSINGGGTYPLKADIKQLNFSLDVSGALGNVIFSQYTIINRSNDLWSNMYISVWSDDDLGDATDDRVGCDSSLSMCYTYNGSNNDPIYGTAPPAVGFVLLKGAYVNTANNNDTVRYCINKTNIQRTGYRDLKMRVFNYSINGNQWFHDPDDFIQSYNLMKGLKIDGSHFTHPAGYITTLPFSGDPVTGLGWLAGASDDYRLFLSSGPVNMNPGDTQVIVTAQVIARGNTTLNSITMLRNYVNELKQFYNSCYTSTPIGVIGQSGFVKRFSLKQNYPNPFNPVTTIQYEIPYRSEVTIRVFDVVGREIFRSVDNRNAGAYDTRFDGTDFSSGIYFYSIEAVSPYGVFSDTKKMVLIK